MLTDAQQTLLRKDFPAAVVGKLPKEGCYNCGQARKDKTTGKPWSTCDRHTYYGPSSPCPECGGKHGSGAIHLDFIGHADTTDRLLSVDPGWYWEPLAFAEDGTPLIKQDGKQASMWIRLFVGDVSRIGVGTCDTNKFEVEKELIGDAIRNAAMRFGVALALWSKSDKLESELEAGIGTTEADPFTDDDIGGADQSYPSLPSAASIPEDVGDDEVKADKIPKAELMAIAEPLGITEKQIIAKAVALQPTLSAKDRPKTIIKVLARPAVAKQIMEIMKAGEFFNSEAEPFGESGEPTLLEKFKAFVAARADLDQLGVLAYINHDRPEGDRWSTVTSFVTEDEPAAEVLYQLMSARVDKGHTPLPEPVEATA